MRVKSHSRAFLSLSGLVLWLSANNGTDATYSCDPSVCLPPGCVCPSTAAPGSLTLKDTPQIMVLTFGDAVTERLYTTIDPLLKKHHLAYAPGCPIPATFLSSVAWADFYSISRLYAAGHEIGSRGFGSFNWGSVSKEVDAKELAAARDALVGWAGIPKNNIQGFRSPGYVLSSDTYKALAADGSWKYDTTVRDRPGSVTTKLDGTWSWPYTLNNGLPIFYGCSGCKDGDSFGSVWELPAPLLLEGNGSPIAGGLDGLTGDDALQALKQSFDARYKNGNKSPYVLNIQPGWLYTTGNVDALDAFLAYVNGQPDTFFLTARALVRWMQSPVPSSAMSSWGEAKCPSTLRPLDASRVSGKCTGSSDDAIRECVYTKNPESPSDTAFYYRTLTCLPSCPVQPPTIAVPVPYSPPPEKACNPPNGGCLYGNWDSSTCKCKCLGEDLQSQNGFCRDPTGRCTVLKTWNVEKNWYESCQDTVANPPNPGECKPPSGACLYGSYDYSSCSCICTNENDQAQIGWCKDAQGRCSVLKTWDPAQRRYQICQ